MHAEIAGSGELKLRAVVWPGGPITGHNFMTYTEFPDLDELIAHGWGDTTRSLIPLDWRTRRGPDRSFGRERKANIGAGIGRKRWGWGKRGQKVQRQPIQAKKPKRRA